MGATELHYTCDLIKVEKSKRKTIIISLSDVHAVAIFYLKTRKIQNLVIVQIYI